MCGDEVGVHGGIQGTLNTDTFSFKYAAHSLLIHLITAFDIILELVHD